MFFAGLFWSPVIPCAYALTFEELKKQNLGLIIFVSAAMALLAMAAIILLKGGISGLISNGKKHLILYDDGLQIKINSGKFKGKVHSVNYAEIKDFCFFSYGTCQDKSSGGFFVKENACGTIDFKVGKEYFCASVYNALPAAQYILDRLQPEQIDKSRNELDKDGKYHPQN